jgi:diacylglycerol kinase family enzyme
MAGDSSITRAINVIIDLEIQRHENIDVFELEDIKKRLRTPFCFIPVGSTNMIAHSIYGTTDYGTPLRYLIHGIKMKIDMSAIFTNADKLQALGFNYSCGMCILKTISKSFFEMKIFLKDLEQQCYDILKDIKNWD